MLGGIDCKGDTGMACVIAGHHKNSKAQARVRDRVWVRDRLRAAHSLEYLISSKKSTDMTSAADALDVGWL